MHTTLRARRFALFSVSALSGLIAGFTAVAQPSPDAKAASDANNDEPLRLDTYVVSGYRQSLQASLDTKRASNAIIDVITAEDVGKYPDTNVAESLAHLPGITVDRLWGQGERVSINGTDPDLNRTLLNGQAVASGNWYVLDQPSRNFNYTLLAPEVVGEAEVYKTSEARLPEGSIGGTVILHTRNPLDLPADTFTGTLGRNYNDLSKKGNWLGSGLYSWRNEEKTIGITVSAQYSKEHLRRDGIENYNISSPGTLDPDGNPDGINFAAKSVAIQNLLKANPDAQYPTQLGTAYFEQDRKRLGYQTGIELKPLEQLTVELNTLWVKADFRNFNDSLYIEPSQADGTDTLTSATIQNGLISRAHFDQGVSLMDAIFDPDSVTKTHVYDFKATWRETNWSVSAQGGRTSADGGAQREVFTEANYQGGYTYDLTNGPRITWDDPSAVRNPAAWSFFLYPFQGAETKTLNKEKENYAQLDGDVSVSAPFLKKLRAGGRYTDHTTSSDAYSVDGLSDNPAFPATYASFGSYSTPSNFLRGLSGLSSDQKNHFLVDMNTVSAFYDKLNYPFTKTASDYPNTWSVQEKVAAGYAQVDYSFYKITGNIGVRYVHTDQISKGYSVDSDGNATPNRSDKTYTNTLPSLNAVYGVTDNFSLRFGASQVIARQNYSSLSTQLVLQDPLPGGVGTGAGGNPKLDPYKSNNFDLSAEWYFTKNSLVQLSGFYRKIANYTKQATFTEQHVSTALGLTNYDVARPVNGGSAESKGWNLAYQQAFGYGFGTTANFTYTDSRGNDGNALPYASKNSVNISPYWENKTWSIHFTYNWRSDYIYLSSINNLNDFVKAEPQLDASISYHFNDNYWISLDGSNLLDAEYQQYLKTPGKFIVSEYKSGRRGELSVHFKF